MRRTNRRTSAIDIPVRRNACTSRTKPTAAAEYARRPSPAVDRRQQALPLVPPQRVQAQTRLPGHDADPDQPILRCSNHAPDAMRWSPLQRNPQALCASQSVMDADHARKPSART